MNRSIANLRAARELADGGRFAELLELLRTYPEAEVEESPGLCLLFAIATARLGDHRTGQEWAQRALGVARRKGDLVTEVRAFNVSGAIAFERGRIDDAGAFFSRGVTAAEAIGDHASVGRCCNNLGNIAYLQGDYGTALGHYTAASAAFERAGFPHGLAEVWHNVAAVNRKQGAPDRALEAADRAVASAVESGDRNLEAQAVAGRAEARLASGDPRLALREVEEARRVHAELGDGVREQEDCRILASVWRALGRAEESDAMLRTVITRAEEHGRPLLRAKARRDLAALLRERGDRDGARDVARSARVDFESLAARGELRGIDRFLAEEDGPPAG